MLENKCEEMKAKPRLNLNSKSVYLQQLQQEIDRLALLVSEAKRQSDRIQAVADALGDAAFEDGAGTILPFTTAGKRQRQSKTEN